MIFRRKRPPKPPPPPCPDCGKPTNLGGRFCRACGWDADVDERGEGYLDGVDVPEAIDDDAYADLLEEEGLGPPGRGRGRRWLWTLVCVVVLAAFAWSAVLWGG